MIVLIAITGYSYVEKIIPQCFKPDIDDLAVRYADLIRRGADHGSVLVIPGLSYLPGTSHETEMECT